ncbi:Uncharacterised protein [Bordetella pertussis]|nr:Uncharacterised protein [Bordetella pertussis]CFP65109.1 Uncharacterised protein [Bordetella pertussis]CFW43277.1 Uncharacterised protein [Bordetella pertussis]
MGWAIGPASSGNWAARSVTTSSMRLTARALAAACSSRPRAIMSALNSWSRNTVRPSLRLN